MLRTAHRLLRRACRPVSLSVLLLTLTLTSASCEPANTGAPTVADDVAMIVVDPAAPVPTSLEAMLLATLAPNRPTVLAAMPDGSTFVVQAPPEDRETNDVQIIAPGRRSAAVSGLTAAAVMRALNIDPGAPAALASPNAATRSARASGRFTAIAARSDGKLAFAFAGVANTRPFFAIGTFDPATGALFLPVDQLTLSAAGDADVASDAARQNLFTAGDDAWLWRATEREIRVVSVLKLSDAEPKLTSKRLALEHVRDATTADIERNAWEWSATPQRGQFLLTDTASRWIRRIDEVGEISHVARFEANAVATLSAAAQDAAGRVIVLACDREGIAQSMLVQDGTTFKAVPTSAFNVPPALHAARLQIDRLLPVPKEANTFVAYDGVSGAVIRVQLR